MLLGGQTTNSFEMITALTAVLDRGRFGASELPKEHFMNVLSSITDIIGCSGATKRTRAETSISVICCVCCICVYAECSRRVSLHDDFAEQRLGIHAV